jgi:hypothetical protein
MIFCECEWYCVAKALALGFCNNDKQITKSIVASMRVEFGEYMTRTEDGGWRRKTNGELTALYKDSNIVQYIKAQRIRCLGHVGKMPDQRYAKKTLLEVERGKKKEGKTEEEMAGSGNNRLKKAGRNGLEQWRKIVKNSCNDMENGM